LKLAGDLDGAKAAYYSAELIFKKSQPSPVLQDLARLENNIAALLAQQGENSRAIYLYHSALEKLIRVFGQDSQEVGIVRSNLASVLLDNRRYDEAAQLLDPALAKALMAMGRMHSDTAHIANNLASAKYYLGNFEGALEPASLALEANRASIGVENPQTIISALNFAKILIKLDRSDRAAAVLSEVVIEAERLWASPKAALVPIIKLAANMLEQLGRKEIAISMLRQFLLAARGRDYQEVVDLHDAILIK
jgi:tetratricopeptide (TPR) repeat protein